MHIRVRAPSILKPDSNIALEGRAHVANIPTQRTDLDLRDLDTQIPVLISPHMPLGLAPQAHYKQKLKFDNVSHSEAS